MTTYRESCGSRMGLRLHQVAGEDICADCAYYEAWKRLAVELIPTRPTPAVYPVTPEQAVAHANELSAATSPRTLRVVRGAA